jgi:hypothetical protein
VDGKLPDPSIIFKVPTMKGGFMAAKANNGCSLINRFTLPQKLLIRIRWRTISDQLQPVGIGQKD